MNKVFESLKHVLTPIFAPQHGCLSERDVAYLDRSSSVYELERRLDELDRRLGQRGTLTKTDVERLL